MDVSSLFSPRPFLFDFFLSDHQRSTIVHMFFRCQIEWIGSDWIPSFAHLGNVTPTTNKQTNNSFHKLFEKATEDHAGIVAMGFIAPPNGLVQGMPLCEIENFKTMEGDTGFGNLSILATIRVVGRANLLDVQDESGIIEGYMTGWCREVSDDNTSGDYELEAYNKLADDCDALFEKIVSLQEELLEEEESGGDEIVLSEATIRRMKLEAELGLDDDDDDDDDDEDDEDEDDEGFGLRSALQTAFDIVKASDTQGYTGVLSSSSEGGSSSATTKTKRSLQDLTALSWAYLSKDVWEDSVDESTLLNCRIRATNVDQLSDRFDLVSKMLSAHEKSLRENLENNRGR
jgi:hypothetical protein